MKLLKFAAIDIGTNAVRILFTNIIEDDNEVSFTKSSIIRVPIRLGTDVFTTGKISEIKQEKLVLAMIAFKNLMEVQDVVRYRACATSAMREATNGMQVVKKIKEESGITIDIIDGKDEAEIIYNNRVIESPDNKHSYLYVDIGGGSTEITLFSKGEIIASKSFNIGTIRLLNNTIDSGKLNSLKNWLTGIKKNYKNIELIGSGGNINKLLKLSREKEGKPLPIKVLKDVYDTIKSYSYKDRIKILGLNPDRADVIIPASDLLFKIIKWSGTKEIIVPKVGIADGIVKQLYSEYRLKK
ncbi:MAG: exopolyphosphatase [Bacteroidetes bacterium GWC2_33_15]|nr:MAG: exopolyphosphatase [Bacteroidetes bacterium GWA2_33_15]OFX48813.1 MAG: exopolyphosphatase [Bacteroidetes bacterium GWC2_33_15]OFX66055.1 MAG: exopolyphosphatase [Bacteroidetes bacterium GWB2_32_14]OFX68183.1 MAG: exopolyphosphatase [Bacteroidetes bacterium GWD2_33_33]HAN17958.1 exopolyphosphatase [Bacteroidales bacterium]